MDVANIAATSPSVTHGRDGASCPPAPAAPPPSRVASRPSNPFGAPLPGGWGGAATTWGAIPGNPGPPGGTTAGSNRLDPRLPVQAAGGAGIAAGREKTRF